MFRNSQSARYLLLFIATLFSFFLQAQEPFITKPYLQVGYHPSVESLQLLWHVADTDAEWMLEYSSGNEGGKKITSPVFFNKVSVKGVAAHRVYHASLNGLTPGKNFTYKLYRNGTEVFTATAVAPKTADQPYRFVVMGDIGAESAAQKKWHSRLTWQNLILLLFPEILCMMPD